MGAMTKTKSCSGSFFFSVPSSVFILLLKFRSPRFPPIFTPFGLSDADKHLSSLFLSHGRKSQSTCEKQECLIKTRSLNLPKRVLQFESCYWNTQRKAILAPWESDYLQRLPLTNSHDACSECCILHLLHLPPSEYILALSPLSTL